MRWTLLLVALCTGAVRATEPELWLYVNSPHVDEPFQPLAASYDGSQILLYGLPYSYRWAPGGERLELGALPGDLAVPLDMSSDGSVVVGESWSTEPPGPIVTPVYWHIIDDVPQVMPMDMDAGLNFMPVAVSGDGGTTIGRSFPLMTGATWTPDGGVKPLAPLVGDQYSSADGVSRDGSSIVGSSAGDETEEGVPVRWRDGEQAIALDGTRAGSARDITADGRVIVGVADFDGVRQAFRWSEAQGIESLHDPVAASSRALAVSDLGTVVVGGGDFGPGQGSAMIWTPGGGMRAVDRMLGEEFGLDLQGWHLRDVYAVSGDGLTLIGTATPAAGGIGFWIAYLGSDSDGDSVPDTLDNCLRARNVDQRDTDGDGFGNRCDPDLDGDGAVTIKDWIALLRVLGSDNADADFDGNGNVDEWDHFLLLVYLFYQLPPGPSGPAPGPSGPAPGPSGPAS